MWLVGLGCLLISFGPPTAFFTLVLARKSTLVIVAIGSGFLWLVGLAAASLVWPLFPSEASPVAAVLLGSVCTDLTRFLFWLVWTRGHESLNQDAGKRLDDRPGLLMWEAIAAGLGSGMASALVYAGALWAVWGPGGLSNANCFGVSVFVGNAVMSLSWTALHVLGTVVAHQSFRAGRLLPVLAQFCGFVLLACASLFNSDRVVGVKGGCVLPAALQAVALALALVYVVRTSK